MTEEEAKTKWCPHSRYKFSALSDVTSANRELAAPGRESPLLREGTRCLGSECMAWRWAQKPNNEWKPQSQMGVFPRNPASDPPMYVLDTERGGCGLAGAVQ